MISFAKEIVKEKKKWSLNLSKERHYWAKPLQKDAWNLSQNSFRQGEGSNASVSRDTVIGVCGKHKNDAMLTSGVREEPWNLMKCIKYCTNREAKAGKLVCAPTRGLGILGLRWSKQTKVWEVNLELRPSGLQRSSLNSCEAQSFISFSVPLLVWGGLRDTLHEQFRNNWKRGWLSKTDPDISIFSVLSLAED